MPLPKQTPLREMMRKFRALGWEGPTYSGKHPYLRKGPRKIHIPNPHGKDEVGRSLLGEILSQAGISEEEWLAA